MITAIVGRIMLVEQWKEYPTRDGKIQFTSILVKDNAEVLYRVDIKIQAEKPDPRIVIGNSIEMVVYIYSDAYEGRYYTRIKCMRYYIINYMQIDSDGKRQVTMPNNSGTQQNVATNSRLPDRDKSNGNAAAVGIAPNRKNNHLDDISF